MNSVTPIQAAMEKTLSREEKVRTILAEEYQYVEQGVAPDPENGLRLMAVDCGTRLFNILFAARNPTEGANYSAMMDLIVNLNSNAFWMKNGAVLMPILHCAMAAQSDYAVLLAEKSETPTITRDDEVRAQCKLAGLELFVMIAFLVSGQTLMATSALQLKRRLAPLLG